MPTRPHRLFGPVLVALLVGLGACGGGDGVAASTPASGCGPDRQERIDPASANHVFVGGQEPDYATDPPTSGPHAPAPPRSGVLDGPLSRPEQVGHLEAGGVLFQYRTDLPDDEVAALESLAGTDVVVAPNPELPDPVVATAWTRKLACGTVDVDALRAFAETHLGEGPGSDG